MNGAVVGTGVAVGSIRYTSPLGVSFDIHDVLLVPDSRRNLISGLQLQQCGLVVMGDTAGGGWRLVHDCTPQPVAYYKRFDSSNQLYLDITPLPPSSSLNVLMCHASFLNLGGS